MDEPQEFHQELDVADFYGKNHIGRYGASTFVLPSTQLKYDRQRAAHAEAKSRAASERLSRIEGNRRQREKVRKLQAEVLTRAHVHAEVGCKIDMTARLLRKSEMIGLKERVKEEPPDPVLLQAIEQRDLWKIRNMLRVGVKGISGPSGPARATALHRAVSLGYDDVTQLLVEAQASVFAKTTADETPLHCCWHFWKGDEGVWYRRQREQPWRVATPEDVVNCERSEIHMNLTEKLLGILLRAGANPNARLRSGATALHQAAARGNMSCVMSLLLAHADHNVRDGRGMTAADLACRAGLADIATTLQNWSSIKDRYKGSEFRGEWMNFCRSTLPLATSPPATSLVAKLAVQEHEANAEVRKRGGFLILDRMISDGIGDSPATSTSYPLSNAPQRGPIDRPLLATDSRPATRAGTRRRTAALRIAGDGTCEGPMRRPATASSLLMPNMYNPSRGGGLHYVYKRRVVKEQGQLQRKSTNAESALGVDADMSDGERSGSRFLNSKRAAFNDPVCLPPAAISMAQNIEDKVERAPNRFLRTLTHEEPWVSTLDDSNNPWANGVAITWEPLIPRALRR